MSKLHFGFGVAITLLFSMMAFSLFIAPALANSATPTIIGGATNGNIFGSVQLDELNFTSTVPIRSNGDDGPVWFTVTYPTTLAWNTTWAHTNMNIDSGVFTGITSLTMAGNIDIAANSIFSGANEMMDFGATTIDFKDRSNLNLRLSDELVFVGNGAGTAGQYYIQREAAGVAINQPTGDLFRISINNVDEYAFGAASVDFNNNGLNNAGDPGNDFGASNTLVATVVSGTLQMSGADFDLNGRTLQNFLALESKASGNVLIDAKSIDDTLDIVSRRNNANNGVAIRWGTNNAADASTARMTLIGGLNTVNLTLSATHLIPSANNTLAIGHNDVRWANIFSVVNTAKSQVTGDINFEGGGLDWTLIESSVLGDKYKGLVLIDKPTIVNGKWVFPENYRRIFEVNEQGVFHLGTRLATNNQISDLQSQINELKQEIQSLREGN